MITVASNHIAGSCDAKCDLRTEYNDCQLQGENEGVLFRFAYQDGDLQPVTYNGNSYRVRSCLFCAPSIHAFDGGRQADAEWIIAHEPVVAGPTLYVAVPVQGSKYVHEGTHDLDTILRTMAKHAPSRGDTTNLAAAERSFSLDRLVPKGPYYAYTDESAANTDWVVFGLSQALPVPPETIDLVRKVLRPYIWQTSTSALFYNPKGTQVPRELSGKIYIRCKPTGASTKKVPVVTEKSGGPSLWTDIRWQWLVRALVVVCSVAILLVIVHAVYRYLFVARATPSSLFNSKSLPP